MNLFYRVFGLSWMQSLVICDALLNFDYLQAVLQDVLLHF